MTRRLASLGLLLVAACGQPTSQMADQPTAEEDAARAQAQAAEPVQFPSERSRDAPPPIAIPRLPVSTGVYVVSGTSCANPANAAFRIYNGTGISGSATRDCRLENARYAGAVYSFDQSCVDTYSGKRTSHPIEVEVTGPDSFMLNDGDEETSFGLCDPAELPDYLAELVGA